MSAWTRHPSTRLLGWRALLASARPRDVVGSVLAGMPKELGGAAGRKVGGATFSQERRFRSGPSGTWSRRHNAAPAWPLQPAASRQGGAKPSSERILALP